MTSIVGLTEVLNVTVTPAPGSVQDTNLTEVAGNAVDTGVGAAGAGTQRVALSSDSKIIIADGTTPITGTLTNNGVLFTVDTLGYNTISVQLSGDWQALCTFQVSNDNIFWANVQGYTFNNYMNSTNTAQDNGVYIFPVTGRYFQVVVSNYKAGTVSTISYLRQQSLAGIGETMLTQAMDQANGTPINIGFQGFNGPGQQNAANSLPVALANEQVLDKTLVGPQFINRFLAVNTSLLVDPSNPVGVANGGFVDCLQYRSIYLTFYASTGTGGGFSFEGSNDAVNWVGTPMFNTAGYTSTAITQSTTFSFPGAGLTIYSGPLLFRYFRLRVNTATTVAATVQVSATFRMTPYVYLTGVTANIQQQGGSGLSAGSTMTSGSPTSASFPPLILGGVDRSVVRQELLGAPYNNLTSYTNGPYARNAYFDLAGAIGAAGPQPFLAEDKTYPVNVRLERSNRGQDSVQDLLQQLLVEVKAMSYYIRELPMTISSMNQTPNPSVFGDPMGMADDPENFFNDPTTFNYAKGN